MSENEKLVDDLVDATSLMIRAQAAVLLEQAFGDHDKKLLVTADELAEAEAEYEKAYDAVRKALGIPKDFS